MRRLVLLVVLFGCSGADSNEPPRIAEVLPDGTVRMANSGDGLWAEETRWRLELELVLGELEGPDELLFGSIGGLEADDDGYVYVIDGQALELRIFSADGSHVRTAGGPGEGPGEYSRMNGLRWLDPDTLVIVDHSGNRYSVLTRAGDYVRSVPRTLSFFRFAGFQGGIDEARLYERVDLGSHPDWTPALTGVDLHSGRADDTAITEPPQAGAGQAVRDTILLPSPSGRLSDDFVLVDAAGTPVGFMPVPFSPSQIYHLDGRGAVWHGHGSEFRILRSTLAGDPLMEITLDTAPDPFDPALIEAWLDSEFVARWRSLLASGRFEGEIEMDRIPGVKPFFDEIYVDPEGFVWVQAPADALPGLEGVRPLERTVEFHLFDPEGRYLGRLEAFGLERPRGPDGVPLLPPVVRGDRLYLAGRGELDVERVYVFRIER